MCDQLQMLSSQPCNSLTEPGTVGVTTSSKELPSSPQVCTVPVLSVPLHLRTPGKRDKNTFSFFYTFAANKHVLPFDPKYNCWTHERQVNKVFLDSHLFKTSSSRVSFLSERFASVCVLSLLHAHFWQIRNQMHLGRFRLSHIYPNAIMTKNYMHA